MTASSETLPPGSTLDALTGMSHRQPTDLQHDPRPALQPEHLPRTLLLVDDEANIISSLKRLLRADGYQIMTASSGQQGLDILAQHNIDVIVSDQRMPGMTGVEFLRKAKEIRPDSVRIVLSGYTELDSVVSAVNEGAIYKFLMKPWDDAQLRGHVDEAFRRKEMADENRRLTLEVSTANFELAAANRRLEEVLKQQQLQISRDEVSLDVVREILQHVPVPVLGLDEDDFIVFSNTAALSLFGPANAMLGCDARSVMPEVLNAAELQIGNDAYRVNAYAMGQRSDSRGKLITLTRRGSP